MPAYHVNQLPSRGELIARAWQHDEALAELHATLTRDGYATARRAARALIAANWPGLAPRVAHQMAVDAVRAARAWAAGERAGWRDNPHRRGDRFFAGRLFLSDVATLPLVTRSGDARAPHAPVRLP